MYFQRSAAATCLQQERFGVVKRGLDMNGKRKSTAGFTLIELLVVVGIIVLLIALLVPALGKAKTSAKVAAVKAQMDGIVRACEHYHTDYNAYPGPVDDRLMDGANVKFSGAQNLLLGLSRRFYPVDPTSALAALTPPGSATKVTGLNAPNQIWFDNDPSKQLADYAPGGSATFGTEPLFNAFSAYLTPKLTDTSTKTQFANSNANLDLNNLPSFVDGAFGADAKPILYYRQEYTWDPENAAAPGGVVGTKFAAALTYDKPATGQATFYASTNTLIDSTVPSTALTLQTMVASPNNVVPPTYTPKGGFLLVSPGPDRLYGTSDDIIMAGGQ